MLTIRYRAVLVKYLNARENRKSARPSKKKRTRDDNLQNSGRGVGRSHKKKQKNIRNEKWAIGKRPPRRDLASYEEASVGARNSPHFRDKTVSSELSPREGREGGGGALIIMHGRSRRIIDPRIPTKPGPSSRSDFHQPAKYCLLAPSV